MYFSCLTLLGDSVSPWNKLFGDCFLSESQTKPVGSPHRLIDTSINSSTPNNYNNYNKTRLKRMFMHFKTSSESKQSPNKLFQGDTLSPNKVKLNFMHSHTSLYLLLFFFIDINLCLFICHMYHLY